MKKRLHLLVYGFVQGVGFRFAAERMAKQAKLTGWARNNPDGSVEIVAEGEEKNLLDFKNWCYNGPKAAQVERVEEKWSEASGEFENFFIKF